jgi:tRNA (guanosine-2'-O-)-methyltransferase
MRYGAIYVTQLAEESVPLYELNLTGSAALVFGNEKDGVSEQAAALADRKFIIPQVGMIQSLNISVACAVTLYECYRQRKLLGLYDRAANSEVLTSIILCSLNGN